MAVSSFCVAFRHMCPTCWPSSIIKQLHFVRSLLPAFCSACFRGLTLCVPISQVPGNVGAYVYVRDAFRWKWEQRAGAGIPFPTFLGPAPQAAVTARSLSDPYKAYQADIDFFSEKWKGGD